ncbi:MAG: AmmeMemoRadiSam system protein A, partial [Chloroflexi bacterium]
ERPFTPPPPEDPDLWQQVGIFVTLWLQDGRDPPPHWPHGHLRGCVGHIQSDLPLYQAIAETAVEAATNDPRFSPLTIVEFNHIHFEISLLSPLILVKQIENIEVGKHGLLITNGVQRGLLLPQVAANRNWDRKEFLTAVCHKANLPSDVWPQSAKLYAFTTIEFVED